MITADHPLIQLLALIDMVWIDAEPGQGKRGGPKFYSEKPLIKVTSPTGNTVVTPVNNHVPVVVELVWPDNKPRNLQFIELTVDKIVQQTMLYPQGTRLELTWDTSTVTQTGASDHQLSIRVRDVASVEASSAIVAFKLVPPTISGTVSADLSVLQAICLNNLLQGWNDTSCVRQRAILFLPWLVIIAIGGIFVIRTWRTRFRGNALTVVGLGRHYQPLAELFVMQGPTHLVNHVVNIYADATAIGRDPRQCDIQLYEPGNRSSISAQHCTIHHIHGRFSLIDNNSENGTQVNGLYIDEPVFLNDGDEITLGIPDRMGAVLRFHIKVIDPKLQETRVWLIADQDKESENTQTTPPLPSIVHLQSRTISNVNTVDNLLTKIINETNEKAEER